MEIIRNISKLKKLIRKWKNGNQTIGFVPTMGALHAGHLSLVKKARKETDRVIVSIFVNPMQFAPHEDLKKYPRPFAKDKALCRQAGADIIFYPTPEEIYPKGFKTYISMNELPDVLCGRSRPGHFNGVMTVVAKLLNITEPDIAYFGLKDYQQITIIKQMVRDININVSIKAMPIIREKDGLAMSSRNQYLTPDLRAKATRLYKALIKAKDSVKKGERSGSKIISQMKMIIKKGREAKIDYVSIVDRDTLQDITQIQKGKSLVALAVFIGKTRLIDNMPL
jgi:pantoate--beta-alanine ligase